MQPRETDPKCDLVVPNSRYQPGVSFWCLDRPCYGWNTACTIIHPVDPSNVLFLSQDEVKVVGPVTLGPKTFVLINRSMRPAPNLDKSHPLSHDAPTAGLKYADAAYFARELERRGIPWAYEDEVEDDASRCNPKTGTPYAPGDEEAAASSVGADHMPRHAHSTLGRLGVTPLSCPQIVCCEIHRPERHVSFTTSGQAVTLETFQELARPYPHISLPDDLERHSGIDPLLVTIFILAPCFSDHAGKSVYRPVHHQYYGNRELKAGYDPLTTQVTNALIRALRGLITKSSTLSGAAKTCLLKTYPDPEEGVIRIGREEYRVRPGAAPLSPQILLSLLIKPAFAVTPPIAGVILKEVGPFFKSQPRGAKALNALAEYYGLEAFMRRWPISQQAHSIRIGKIFSGIGGKMEKPLIGLARGFDDKAILDAQFYPRVMPYVWLLQSRLLRRQAHLNRVHYVTVSVSHAQLSLIATEVIKRMRLHRRQGSGK